MGSKKPDGPISGLTGCGNGAGATSGNGRFSLRRFLFNSPLLGRRLRSAAHRVVEGHPTAKRSATPAQNTAAKAPTPKNFVEDGALSEEDEDMQMECPLCLGTCEASNFPRLCTCHHRSCLLCLRKYLTIEIQESRVAIACAECSEPMHPNDIKKILDNQSLYEKYEDFMVRRVLAADPDTRWCPAPDCNFAVVAQGCASCPELLCHAPGCGRAFCYHCKAAWHPDQTCDAARRQRQPPPAPPPPPQQQETHTNLVKPCPRCSVLIVKIEDGSCNHMVCCVCGSEFCWLCMKEISDLHYLSPSGCTFWGKAPWSRKKKLLWQLGTLAGAPLGIALLAGVAAPALLLCLPVWAGRRASARCRRLPPAKRRAIVAAAVALAIVAAPAVAGLAVGIGVPILLFYVYGVVPVSLCRSGGCGVTTSPRGGVRFDFDEDGDEILTRAHATSSPDLADASSTGLGATGSRNSPGGSGDVRGSPMPLPSLHDRINAIHHRLEVTADVVSALRLSLSSEAASLSEPLPPDDASTRALAGSIRDYRQNQSETVSYSAAEDGASERVRFDDNVSIIAPSCNADFAPDALTDKNSICSSRSFRSLGKSSITEELSESLDKSSIGSGPKNVIFEENLDDVEDCQESPCSQRSNSQSSLPGNRRPFIKMNLKTNHKYFSSFEQDVTSQTPPDVVKYLERTDKVMTLINKQSGRSGSLPGKVVVSSSYADIASVHSTSPSSETKPIVETSNSPETLPNQDATTPVVMREHSFRQVTYDPEVGVEIPKRPLSKVAMLRNIFFHGSSMVDEEHGVPTEVPMPVPSTSAASVYLNLAKKDNNDEAVVLYEKETISN